MRMHEGYIVSTRTEYQIKRFYVTEDLDANERSEGKKKMPQKNRKFKR